MYGRKWKPSKAAAAKFRQQMEQVDEFCETHGIHASASQDSYYFKLNGVSYRVSNHSVEASNAHAFDALGNQIRDKYHPNGRNADTVYIHAGKTRIIQIYNDLASGYILDGRGNRKEPKGV